MCGAEGLPEWFCNEDLVGDSPRSLKLEHELKAGRYGVIRSLLRVLEGGAASKVGRPLPLLPSCPCSDNSLASDQ